jgi:hypothetical protein
MDVGGFHVIHPLAMALRAAGHNVCVCAEGKSVNYWQDAGLQPLWLSAPDIRSKDVQLVITGIGSPRPIAENELGLQANERRIPYVAVEDYWAKCLNLTAKPDLIVTLDSIARNILRQDDRYAQTRMLLAGHPHAHYQPKPEVVAWAEKLRAENKKAPLIFFAGGLEETEPSLMLMLTSLRGSDYRLVTRMHPRFQEFDGKAERIEMLLKGFAIGARLPRDWRVLKPEGASGDDLAAVCDITVSPAGTALLVAAMKGKVAVNVDTPACAAALHRAGVPYSRYPGCEVNIAANLSTSTYDLLRWAYYENASKLIDGVRKYRAEAPMLNTEEILKEILTLVR